MSFIFRRSLEGNVTPNVEEFLQDNVSIVKGQLLDTVSGYASNASPTAHVTSGILGVADESVDNSGGDDGATSIAVVVNRNAIYEILTVGTPTQAQMGTSVVLATAGSVTESSAVTDETGTVQMLKLKDATNLKVYGKLNFAAAGAQ